MHRTLPLILVLSLLGCPQAHDKHELPFESEIVGDTFDLIVLVPVEEEFGEGPFPTVYFHDGDYLFRHEEEIRRRTRNGTIDPVVIVAIAYQGGTTDPDGGLEDETMDRRARDLTWEPVETYPGTGHADEYHQFVRDELVPFIEEQYAVLPGRENRIAAGYSGFGANTLYGLFHYNETHAGYCAGSPSVTVHESQLFDFEAAADPAAIGDWLYWSVGTNEDNTDSIQAFGEQLEEHGYADLDLAHDVFQGKDHTLAMVPWFKGCLDQVSEHH